MTPLATLILGLAAALALWQLLAFAAAPPSALKSLVKTASVALLAGVLLAQGGAGAGDPAFGPAVSGGVGRGAILAGLALGAAGDFFLSRPGTRAFLAGMAAFAGGHLAYALGFWQAGTGAIVWPGAALGAAVLALAAALWIAPRAGGLATPVRAYIAVILAMALAALTVPAPVAVALGAGVFMASDLVLALQMFVLPEGRARRLAAYAVWALYWPAQALIMGTAL